MGTKSPSSSVLVFDYSKHGSTPTDNICKPQHRCLGHTAEGYGLAWNPHVEGQLLSGSDDATLCIWDLKEAKLEVNATQKRIGHTDVVEDVDYVEATRIVVMTEKPFTFPLDADVSNAGALTFCFVTKSPRERGDNQRLE